MNNSRNYKASTPNQVPRNQTNNHNSSFGQETNNNETNNHEKTKKNSKYRRKSAPNIYNVHNHSKKNYSKSPNWFKNNRKNCNNHAQTNHQQQPPRFHNNSSNSTNNNNNAQSSPIQTSRFHDISSSGNIHFYPTPKVQDLPWRGFEEELIQGSPNTYLKPLDCMFGWSTWKPEDACPTCQLNIDLIRPVFKKNSIKNLNSSQLQLKELIAQGTQFHGYNYFQMNNDQHPSLADVGKLFIGALPHDFQP